MNLWSRPWCLLSFPRPITAAYRGIISSVPRTGRSPPSYSKKCTTRPHVKKCTGWTPAIPPFSANRRNWSPFSSKWPMISLRDQLEQVDWAGVSECINDKGYALVRDLLDIQQANALAALYDRPTGFRKTVDMERYRFGSGTYKYFDHPLPGEIQTIREMVYPKLVPLANLWMEALNIDKAFPPTYEGLRELCRQKGQGLASPLILKYGKGGFNTLHQDLYGDVYFPFQAVLF